MQAIDRILSAAVTAGDVPCVAAMAADRNGVIYNGAFGPRVLGGADPLQLDTPFRLHSMTKAITAVAAMQLVERGLIGLDEPLGPRFAEYAARPVLEGFAEDGTPRLRPSTRPMTLRHLLTHTAGFSYDMWNADTLRWQKATRTPGSGSGRLASLDQPLAFEPGTRWQYSIAIDHVGRIVEKLSGLDLESYFRRHILDPLGMAETTFVQSEAQKVRRVGMHKRTADGGIETIVLDRPEVTEYQNGGGGLFGTVPEYLAFTRCLMAGGAPLVKPETFAEMRRPQLGTVRLEVLRAAMPAFVHDVEFWPGKAKDWSLSFLVNREPTEEGRAAGSLAWAGLSNLYYWIDLERGLTGVLATQMLPFFDARAYGTFRAFERAIYDAAG
jgi:CubicO group peptidase (beta-lactamase class C family)